MADLIDLPMEVDEFTIRMISLEVAHLKVKVNYTKPLPSSSDIERENGEIARISIDYLWTPPICPCCKELGHLETVCPNAKWIPKGTYEKDNAGPGSHVHATISPSTVISHATSVRPVNVPMTPASPISDSPDGLILNQYAVFDSVDQITHLVAMHAHFSSRPKPIKVLNKY